MRKTLTALALTAALTGGTTAAVTTFAAPAQAVQPSTSATAARPTPTTASPTRPACGACSACVSRAREAQGAHRDATTSTSR